MCQSVRSTARRSLAIAQQSHRLGAQYFRNIIKQKNIRESVQKHLHTRAYVREPGRTFHMRWWIQMKGKSCWYKYVFWKTITSLVSFVNSSPSRPEKTVAFQKQFGLMYSLWHDLYAGKIGIDGPQNRPACACLQNLMFTWHFLIFSLEVKRPKLSNCTENPSYGWCRWLALITPTFTYCIYMYHCCTGKRTWRSPALYGQLPTLTSTACNSSYMYMYM